MSRKELLLRISRKGAVLRMSTGTEVICGDDGVSPRRQRVIKGSLSGDEEVTLQNNSKTSVVKGEHRN